MIFSKIQLIGAGFAVAAAVGAFTWFYFEGKENAKQECLREQAHVIKLWQEALEDAEAKNKVLAENLAKEQKALQEAKTARTKRIIKYVESDPDSDSIIFDADGLSILNSAQKGISTESK
jgi:hypothetical protein